MDGGWFRLIALDWYDRHDGVGGIAEYPFFPLFPAAGGVLMRLGVPSTVALAGLSWAAALLAMAGRPAARDPPRRRRAGDLTPWVIALAPGGLSLILGYSDAFYLAALIWALVAVDHRRWWLAGVLAAVATASRPNGVIAVIAVDRGGAPRSVPDGGNSSILVAPSVAFLAGWMVYLDATTGDALLFWTAKAGWVEMTLLEFLADPLHQRLALTHIVLFLIFLRALRDAVPTPASGVGRDRRARGAPVARARRRRRRPLRRAGVPDPDRRSPTCSPGSNAGWSPSSCRVSAICPDDLRPLVVVTKSWVP